MSRTELIKAARGDRPLDLLIRNANLINVFTCEIYPADIGIYGERIALVAPAGAYELETKQVMDDTGKEGTCLLTVFDSNITRREISQLKRAKTFLTPGWRKQECAYGKTT